MLALLAPSAAYLTVPARAGPISMIQEGQSIQQDKGRYMYGEPFAPEGMGREFINADVRRPLSEYVGASEELNLNAYFKGETSFEPWDPWGLTKLSKVSANNPDVAWLREAELKHGRIAMAAFAGILITSAGIHFDAPVFADATAAGWPNSLGVIQTGNPGIFFQMLAAAGVVEGVSNTGRGRSSNDGKSTWWDGLWFGAREGSGIEPGDIGFDPLRLMPKDPKAAELMKLKELKNGRLAMMAIMGIFFEYINTGKAFGSF